MAQVQLLLLAGNLLWLAAGVSTGDSTQDVLGTSELGSGSRGHHVAGTSSAEAVMHDTLLRRQAAAEGAAHEFLTLGSWRDLGVRRPWILAIGACLLSSVLCIFGFMLQKCGVEKREEYYCIGSIVLSPQWLAGVALLIGANLFGDYQAYSLAPLSLTAPLSGVTVVLNLIIVPRFLGERSQFFPDVPATMLICIGGALTSLYGAHNEKDLNKDRLLELLEEPSNIFLYVVLLLSIALLARLNTSSLEDNARLHLANPKLVDVIIPACTAAFAGCLLNLHLKAVAELIKHNASFWTVVLSSAMCAPYALVQINYISRGLRLYMQTIFVPVYTSILMTCLTLSAAAFYREDGMLQFPTVYLFLFGFVCSLLGLFALTFRKGDDVEDALDSSLSVMESRLKATSNK